MMRTYSIVAAVALVLGIAGVTLRQKLQQPPPAPEPNAWAEEEKNRPPSIFDWTLRSDEIKQCGPGPKGVDHTQLTKPWILTLDMWADTPKDAPVHYVRIVLDEGWDTEAACDAVASSVQKNIVDPTWKCAYTLGCQPRVKAEAIWNKGS